MKIKLPEEPIYLDAIPGELQQTLVNLILNAIQASNQGNKIILTVEKVDSESKQKFQFAGKGILIQVSDEGSGIPKTELGNIFKPFYTTHNDGTGLGLAIVKRISHQNKWHLDVKSQPGKGTKFSILIPQNDK